MYKKISSRYLLATQANSKTKTFRDYELRHNNRSLENLHNPFKQPMFNRLPKDKRLQKPSNLNMNIHIQSEDRLFEKSSITKQNNTYRSTLFDDDSIYMNYRRSKNPGLCHSLSLQSIPQSTEKGTLNDIGVDKNRKRNGVFGCHKPNPILINDQTILAKPHLKTAFENPRAQRDKGKRMRNTLIWQTKKSSTYLQRYRAARLLQ